MTNTQLGAGQLASVDGPLANDTITYTYDSLGRVKTRAIDGVAQAVTYDALGRVTVVTNALGTFSNAYVGVTGRLSTNYYPNGQQTVFSYYGATNDFRLERISHSTITSNLSTFSYTYDADGQIATWTQQADVQTPQVWVTEYDPVDQLLGVTVRSNTVAGAILKRFAYGYDKAGNRTSETVGTSSTSSVTSASHNNLNQLTSTTGGGAVRFTGSLDELGTVTVGGSVAPLDSRTTNFVGYAQTTAGTNTVPVIATDYSGNARTNNYQLVVTNNGVAKTLLYDLNGNLTNAVTATTTNSYEWDAEDRLVAINSGTNRSEFAYDGLSRLVRIIEKTNGVAQSTNWFVWCGMERCEERDSTGATVTKRFFDQGQINYLPSALNLFYTTDHLGSIREMTDSTGAVRARYEYDPYGRVTQIAGDLASDFRYTGHYYHVVSGLHLAPFRAYDADSGRWLSRDPIQEAGGFNLYAYVGNNPANVTDSLGLIEDWPEEWNHNAIQKYREKFRLSGINIDDKRWGTVMPSGPHDDLHALKFDDAIHDHLHPNGRDFVPTNPKKFAKFLKALKQDPDFADLFALSRPAPVGYKKWKQGYGRTARVLGILGMLGLVATVANAESMGRQMACQMQDFIDDRKNGQDDWALVNALDMRQQLNSQSPFAGDLAMRSMYGWR